MKRRAMGCTIDDVVCSHGMKLMCVASVQPAYDMPNWIMSRRGELQHCSEDDTYEDADGFRTGCFPSYINGTLAYSTKMTCESGRQSFQIYMSEDCSGVMLRERYLGTATEFDVCKQTKRPYVWRTTHCETTENDQ